MPLASPYPRFARLLGRLAGLTMGVLVFLTAADHGSSEALAPREPPTPEAPAQVSGQDASKLILMTCPGPELPSPLGPAETLTPLEPVPPERAICPVSVSSYEPFDDGG